MFILITPEVHYVQRASHVNNLFHGIVFQDQCTWAIHDVVFYRLTHKRLQMKQRIQGDSAAYLIHVHVLRCESMDVCVPLLGPISQRRLPAIKCLCLIIANKFA